MRIDLYNSTTTEATKQLDKSQLDKSADLKSQFTTQKTTTEDKATLSSGSDSVTSLSNAALAASPSRTARVESLKQQVSTGQYKLDPAKIADSIASSVV